MSKHKKPFKLGADVEKALDDILSINDNLPEGYKAKARERAERYEETRNGR